MHHNEYQFPLSDMIPDEAFIEIARRLAATHGEDWAALVRGPGNDEGTLDPAGFEFGPIGRFIDALREDGATVLPTICEETANIDGQAGRLRWTVLGDGACHLWTEGYTVRAACGYLSGDWGLVFAEVSPNATPEDIRAVLNAVRGLLDPAKVGSAASVRDQFEAIRAECIRLRIRGL